MLRKTARPVSNTPRVMKMAMVPRRRVMFMAWRKYSGRGCGMIGCQRSGRTTFVRSGTDEGVRSSDVTALLGYGGCFDDVAGRAVCLWRRRSNCDDCGRQD